MEATENVFEEDDIPMVVFNLSQPILNYKKFVSNPDQVKFQNDPDSIPYCCSSSSSSFFQVQIGLTGFCSIFFSEVDSTIKTQQMPKKTHNDATLVDFLFLSPPRQCPLHPES